MRSLFRIARLLLALVVAVAVFSLAVIARQDKPTPTPLAINGKALLPIIVGKDASERTRQTAKTLAAYLAKISGAKFEIQAGDSSSGLVVGTAKDFPALARKQWDANDPTRSEDYLLHSHPHGVHVVGASDLAVEDAVWDLLHRLGYRQFFPSATWEVIPETRDLKILVDAQEHPSYYSRRIWYGYGPPPWSAAAYADWCVKNRAVNGIDIHSGHSYDGILARNKKEFEKHAEYLGLLNGKRTSTKFCISNPGLCQLVVVDALAHFAKEPALQCVSVDPSDGGGWCECDECKKLGSISDRAVTLANEVAAAVAAKYPGKFVALYAYSQHAPPPSIKVHPRVVINVATAFIKGDYTVDQLLDGWQKQGATVGIREYYSVHPWDRDLPGKSHGADLKYLQMTIPHFHDKGARFLSAESSDNWGPNGLGYYLAARMLWDVREAKNVEALRADFLDKAFGPAREPMARFYQLIDAANRPLLSDDLIGRLYRALAEARAKTGDANIRARLDDLVLYTRYLEQWSDYSKATGADRQKAYEALVKDAYRMRKRLLIHTAALVRDVPRRDKAIAIPAEAADYHKEAENPWISNEPYTSEEMDALVAKGIAQRKLFDFTPLSFSDKLVPATPLKLANVSTGTMGLYSRGVRNYYTWIEKAPATLMLKATGGIVYTTSGDARFALYPSAEVESKAVDHATVTPDKKEHEIALKTNFTGLHRLELSDRTGGTTLTWSDSLPMTVASSPDQPGAFHGRWTMYFYVPKGTKVIGGFSEGAGNLVNGSGKTVHTFAAAPGYFNVPVESGEDGKLWKFQNSQGQRLLMTVPPYLARNGQELLLPAEVIERDAKSR
jgi:Domain of unknown function (DUF4838)